MYLLPAFLFTLFHTTLTAATRSPTNLISGLTIEAAASSTAITLPACALTCLSQTIPASGCEPTSLTCICNNPVLSDLTASCLLANCTIEEALTTKKFQVEQCDVPPRERGPGVIVLEWVMWSLATLFVVLRLAARSRSFGSGSGFGWDDALIMVCLILQTGNAINTIFMVQAGLGKDVWNISFQAINNVFMYLWASDLIYVATVGLTKISILQLYLRIFPSTVRTRFRTICFVSMALSLAFLLSIMLTIIFACNPIDGPWHVWTGQWPGKCIDAEAVLYAAAIINMVLDVWIFVLPIPKVWRLEMDPKKKIAVSLTFLVGLVVTGCSIARIPTVPGFKSENPTQNLVDIVDLSCAETGLGIVCASVPAAARIMRRWMGSSKTRDLFSFGTWSSRWTSKYSASSQSTASTSRTRETEKTAVGSEAGRDSHLQRSRMGSAMTWSDASEMELMKHETSSTSRADSRGDFQGHEILREEV